MSEKNILFIHGYASSGSGTTATNIKTVFKNIIAPDFEITNFKKTNSQILKLLDEVDIIIGHSLGGFYTANLDSPKHFKILINPCLDPKKL